MKAPAGNRSFAVFLPALAFAAALAQGGPLLPCTGTDFVSQETQQTNCLVSNPGGTVVDTASYTNDPTYVNTPVTASVNQYQTTLTALLNGGTTVFQETFFAPFSDPSVQSAILVADALLTSDGATFGSPLLTSNSTTLQSSVLSYVQTSPVLALTSLPPCLPIIGLGTAGICSGVTATATLSTIDTFGPANIMTGLGLSDEFVVLSGQLDINLNYDFTYNVVQNAVTTNTYLTTQSYDIDGATSASSVPEPGTWRLTGCALVLLAFRRRLWARP
jgi:hypothetical protein